jgi:hypothetical protein
MDLEAQILHVVGADVLYRSPIIQWFCLGQTFVTEKIVRCIRFSGTSLPLLYIPVPKHTTWLVMTRCN